MRELLHGRKWWLAGAAVVAVLVVAGLAVALGGGEDEPPDPAPGPAPEAVEEPADPPEPGPAADEEFDVDEAEAEHGPPALDESELSSPEREAARTVRAYVRGLTARDGEAVCTLLAPGVIDEVELPRRRGGCGPSLSASIGYRDPRGLPVWGRARVQALLTVIHEDDRASVTATVVTRFADRPEPSIEDDVVHLRRLGGEWRIAKASSTLYRAVGIAEIPPDVLLPPR